MNYFKKSNSHQKGSSLLTVLVVLLVLSLLAVASFDSSNLQSLMTRNSQLRLETFNIGKAEVDAQAEGFESTGGNVNTTIAQLIDTPSPSATVTSTAVSTIPGFSKTATISKDGTCISYGSEINSGTGSTCTNFIIRVTTAADNLNISSGQNQTFTMNTLN